MTRRRERAGLPTREIVMKVVPADCIEAFWERRTLIWPMHVEVSDLIPLKDGERFGLNAPQPWGWDHIPGHPVVSVRKSYGTGAGRFAVAFIVPTSVQVKSAIPDLDDNVVRITSRLTEAELDGLPEIHAWMCRCGQISGDEGAFLLHWLACDRSDGRLPGGARWANRRS